MEGKVLVDLTVDRSYKRKKENKEMVLKVGTEKVI